jgi:hypothetical protein
MAQAMESNSTQVRLKDCFEYNPQTGMFTRKVRTARCTQVGETAGWINALGYTSFNFDRKTVAAHRMAFLYMTGNIPKYIDHINGNKSDNRWENLRAATQSQNMGNSALNKSNTSGFKGVTFSKRRKKFVAQIMKNGKGKFLGHFSNPEDAHAAYCKAALELHGEFANFG